MSEMVERLVGVLCDLVAAEGFLLHSPAEVARAAIEAMREPTPEMSTAGKHAVKGCESTFERDIAESAWTVMIDAALTP